jgi:hypothetical protein
MSPSPRRRLGLFPLFLLPLSLAMGTSGRTGAEDLGSFLASIGTLPLAETDEECTIAILAGSATPDGRPILYKNRDTGSVNNEVAYFTDGLFRYVTIINAGEMHRAWLGVNDQGFAVLNALSYNIADSIDSGITNGTLMKWALMRCKTVSDFEALLEETNTDGRNNPSNLGVIDAAGGATMFEVGNHFWRRYDATDPADAPDGFLIRTNFSLCADTSEAETHRYNRARRLVEQAVEENRADVRFILQTVARDLLSPAVDPYPLPFDGSHPLFPPAMGYVDALITINRRSTVASGAIAGVLPGENPLLSTFYAIVGHPVLTITLPVWVAAGPTPEVLDGASVSQLCTEAQRRAVDAYDWPGVYFLLNTKDLVTDDEDGFLDRVERIEHWVFPAAAAKVEQWRSEGIDPADAATWERRIADQAFAAYMNRPRFGYLAYTMGVQPNPTYGDVAVSYRMDQPPAAAWSIDVLDATGRRVARLAPPEWRSAAGSVWWDGRDAHGRPVASGVYFLKPSGLGAGAAQSVTVMR